MIDDVQAFLDAWRVAAPHEVTTRPDAAIRLALLRLGLGVAGRVARGKTEESALKPFRAAVEKKDAFPTDPSTLNAHTLRDGDRMLINVVMGSASAVFAFDGKGRALPVPADWAWSPAYEGPLRRVGHLLMFDSSSIQDMGVRYAFRLGFVRRTANGYAAAGKVKGYSTYDFDDEGTPRLVVKGTRLIVKGLESPRAFL